MTRYFSIFSLVILILQSCDKNNCDDSKIDLSNDKLPSIETKAANISEIFNELDESLNQKFKNFLKCKSEDDFRDDNISPGIRMWIEDSWRILDDSSNIGQYFAKEGIFKYDRVRIIGTCYIRHLNEEEPNIAQVLNEYKIKKEFNGRLRNVSLIGDFSNEEKFILKSVTRKVDSLMSIVGENQLRVILRDSMGNKVREIIELRTEVFRETNLINEKMQRNENYKKELHTLTTIGYDTLVNNFEELSIGTKLITLEKIKFNILSLELKYINLLKKEHQ